MFSKFMKCKDCKKEISKKAESCPHCGRSYKKKPTGCFTIIVAMFFIGWVFSIITDNSNYGINNHDTINKNFKKETKIFKNWDDGLSESEKQQVLNHILSSTGSEKMTVNDIEELQLSCVLKIMGETIINKETYFSKNREQCITFMNGFYPKKLLDDKNHCLSYNWNDSSEKTTKYKKYCTHFFNTYFENEIEILNKKIK